MTPQLQSQVDCILQKRHDFFLSSAIGQNSCTVLLQKYWILFELQTCCINMLFCTLTCFVVATRMFLFEKMMFENVQTLFQVVSNDVFGCPESEFAIKTLESL